MRKALLLSSLLVFAGCTHVEYRGSELESAEDGAVVMRFLRNVYPNGIRPQWGVAVERQDSQGKWSAGEYRLHDTGTTPSLSTVFIASLPAGTYRFVGQCKETLLCNERYKPSATFTVNPAQLTDLGVMVRSEVNGRFADTTGSPPEPRVTARLIPSLAPGLKPLLKLPVLTWDSPSERETRIALAQDAARRSVGVYSVRALADGSIVYGSINGVVYHWTPGQEPQPHDIGLRVSVESVLVTPGGRWLAGGEMGVLQESLDQGRTWHEVNGNLPFGVVTSLVSWRNQVIATVMENRHVAIYRATEGDSNWTLLARHKEDVSLMDPMLMKAMSVLADDHLITTVPGHKLATLDLASGASTLRDLPSSVGALAIAPDGTLRAPCPSGVSGDICESRDEGRSWRALAHLSRDNLNALFLDAKRGVAVDGPMFAQAYLTYTDDGGVTWNRSQPLDLHLNQLFYDHAGNKVYLFSQMGEFWESADDGRHWKRLSKGI